ncbi:alpha/beta fold hydrolase [Streptacidiphilus anmyonensis]|uniref:alpha/beta fold hydrolase n=1 Tax=Streptacidiphilus anmyonensis TaxID=405782 RepID=UPI0005A92CDA|nr:alpha/beta hydrolase [Streptacidiphilus anmyonensis]
MPKRRTLTLTASAAVLAAALGLTAAMPSAGATVPPGGAAVLPNGPRPTIVLVHGAWADSSSWGPVIKDLQRDGYTVKAPAVPLRGLAEDAAYVASVLKQTPGPVVLVGHSYGGAVVTQAAPSDPEVKALVYVAAFVPDVGDSLGSLSARPVAHPIPQLPLVPLSYPKADGSTGTDLYIDPAKYHQVFLSGRLSDATARALAAEQRPLSLDAVTGTATAAGWKTVPSWYLVAKQDQAIAPDLERWMAARAGAHTVEVNAPHLAMAVVPEKVADLIEEAARSAG